MEYSIVDKVEPAGEVAQLPAGEREDVFTRLVMGKDVTSKVATSRGEFVVKYPKRGDAISIGRIMAYRRNGLPAASFDAVTERSMMVCASLDAIVVTGPDWFTAARKANPNFSFQEVPDEDFLEELYRKACDFREEMQKVIGKGAGAKAVPVSSVEGNQASLGDGLFDGLSDGVERH
jgi:hypothetical protein